MIDIDLTELTRINTRLSEEMENFSNVMSDVRNKIVEISQVVNITGFSQITESVRDDININANSLNTSMRTISGFITRQVTEYTKANEAATSSIDSLNMQWDIDRYDAKVDIAKRNQTNGNSSNSTPEIWGVDDGSYIIPGSTSINNGNNNTQNTTVHTNPAFQDMIDNPTDPINVKPKTNNISDIDININGASTEVGRGTTIDSARFSGNSGITEKNKYYYDRPQPVETKVESQFNTQATTSSGFDNVYQAINDLKSRKSSATNNTTSNANNNPTQRMTGHQQ